MIPGNSADHGQNSASVNSNAEINRLSSELNSRLSREMDEMMNSVNIQIQRAISDAIINQILPQIQNALKTGSRHVTNYRWNVPAERPEINPQDCRSEKTRNNSRSEPTRDCLHSNQLNQAHNRYLLVNAVILINTTKFLTTKFLDLLIRRNFFRRNF